MRGALAVLTQTDAEHSSYTDCPWRLELSETDSFVCVTYNGKRILSTHPDVVAYFREIHTTIQYAHWISVDDVPTDADLGHAILVGEVTPH